MSRRLPVYLLLDTSGSMTGEPIEQVKNGVQMLVASLRQDPYALETAWLSVITFSSDANLAVPLTELTAFQPPSIDANGSTNLGAALELVANCVKKDLVKTTPTTKGDWRPMVFLMTDGNPDDGWQNGLARFRQEKWGVIVGCCVDNGDETSLKQITESVVRLNTSDTASMKAFFKWISASVSQGSKSVEQAGKDVQGLSELPPPPPEIKVVV
jgi:uncharacterized protein YegL